MADPRQPGAPSAPTSQGCCHCEAIAAAIREQSAAIRMMAEATMMLVDAMAQDEQDHSSGAGGTLD